MKYLPFRKCWEILCECELLLFLSISLLNLLANSVRFSSLHNIYNITFVIFVTNNTECVLSSSDYRWHLTCGSVLIIKGEMCTLSFAYVILNIHASVVAKQLVQGRSEYTEITLHLFAQYRYTMCTSYNTI